MTEQATMEATPAVRAQVAPEEAREQVTEIADAGGARGAGEALIADELLVEEVSIDGMCGVY